MKALTKTNGKKLRRLCVVVIALLVAILLWPVAQVIYWASRGDEVFYVTNQQWMFEASQVVTDCGETIVLADVWRAGPVHMMVVHKSETRVRWIPTIKWPISCKNGHPFHGGEARGGSKRKYLVLPAQWLY